MKFTEEEAYKELVAQMTSKGETLQISERTMKAMLKRYYSKFANDETELSDFVKDNIDDFKEVDGQTRKDNADFIKNYQKANPIKKEEHIDKPNNEPKSELETLMAEMAALKSKLEKTEKEQVITSKKQSLLSKMKELGVKDDEWANAVLSKVNISEDIDVEAEANDYLSIYNKVVASVKPTTTPKDSHHTDTTNSDFERIRKEREKELEQLKKI